MEHTVSREIADVVQRVRSGMVKISNGHHGNGAGCILHEEGLIVTNAHVLQGNRIQVELEDDRQYEAKVIARDRSLDLAALMIEGCGLLAIEMGNSGRVKPGELVFSLGYPWGMNGGLTFGVVIHLGPWPTEASRAGIDLLAASLHLRPGHSGGPMFNVQGELIGLNTLMQGPDVGVAVPIDTAKRFLREAMGLTA
jgi:S1-C subfamily serine protease